MHPRQVVVLHEVLAHELPVRLDLVGAGAGEPPLVEPVAREALREVAERLGERSRGRVQAGEDQRAERVDGDRQQRVVGLVERRRRTRVEDRALVVGDARAVEQRRAQAAPLEVVGPAVVRAADRARDPAGALVEQPGPAVTADVVEAAQDAVAPSGDDHRAAGHVHDDGVPRLGDLAGAAHRDPPAREHPLALDGEERLGGVRVGDQRGGGGHGPAGARVGGLGRVVRGCPLSGHHGVRSADSMGTCARGRQGGRRRPHRR